MAVKPEPSRHARVASLTSSLCSATTGGLQALLSVVISTPRYLGFTSVCPVYLIYERMELQISVLRFWKIRNKGFLESILNSEPLRFFLAFGFGLTSGPTIFFLFLAHTNG